MTFQAYLDTIKARTGKTPEDFKALAAEKGLTKYSELMTWLKSEYELGHGHANVIAQMIANADKLESSPQDMLAAHFPGGKARWRAAYDALAKAIGEFGPEASLAPNRSYINALRGGKKFAILQTSSAERFDIGIKLKGVVPVGRFEAAGAWNAMVTHRVSINNPEQMDAEVLAWLRQAYDAAG